MSITLDDYQDILSELPGESLEVLRASWLEAARTFSPRGLDNYLNGALALKNLGRGGELVTTYLQEAPEIAREIGEDAVPELVHQAMLMASRTSGAVIEMIFATAPTAARRLGDKQLFEGYLQLLNTLIAQAPRGLRPMLDKLDQLLGQLTLGGLRRWALWGAQAHRTDFPGQVRYFGLESKESQAVLQRERKGTLFVDVQRRLNMYLRALWGRDFFMRPTSGDYETREGYRPYIEDYLIHLPDAFDDFEGVNGIEVYRAAAAHAAAHVVYTRQPISAEGLSALQMAAISVVEDARVETLAERSFPGLGQLWRNLHTASPDRRASLGDYLNRIARALSDKNYRDDHPIVARARELFAAAHSRLVDNAISWDIGVALAHELGGLGIAYNPRTDGPTSPYRDDNRYFWAFAEYDFARAAQAGYENLRQVRKYVNLMEFVNEIDVETAGDDAQEIWVLATELFPYEDEGVSYNQMEGKEPVSDPYHYAEWDYQIQLERPGWCTVLEKRAKLGDVKSVDDIVVRHKPIVARLKHLIEALQPQGVQRLRRLEDGDEIDLNTAIGAMIDIRNGRMPEPRFMMRNVRKVRDLSVLVLLDLSESTNETVRGSEQTVLELAREATALLADAIHKIGDPFAIHGFASNGRHDIEYYRFKDFEGAYDDQAKARLSGITGQLSTRMGAAMRHAGRYLAQRPSAKKLLLVVTDGEPADIDVRDPQYLRFDARKAVEELGRAGVMTYALSLDPQADPYVSRIFGANRYLVVDHVQRLPEKLPLLYLGLTR
ncbi:nitric oxide reductase activation protein NorD [Methylococcus sp. Mc7]|uniref:nitric oxide reductase activation protein NorD n=1 Tax=Methylococcus sp. Mc7 TaxID=2860258 RepID=UPI001C52FCED|nr:nitric oxide reductase activation protein NorD [Methylococcus sp. Mc7]QXP85736.1 nitric oxide reductase activation protein NorD [Methylococcus sp. Mc7]